MSKLTKIGLVLGGYVIACLAASGVVYVYELLTQNATAQASSGMYAFSDLLLFITVLGILGFFPTALALYFLYKKLQAR